VPEVEFHGLARKQVDRDRVTVEGVEHQDIKVLQLAVTGLGLKQKAGIADFDVDPCGRIFQKRKRRRWPGACA
jgi:hypothetical protein